MLESYVVTRKNRVREGDVKEEREPSLPACLPRVHHSFLCLTSKCLLPRLSYGIFFQLTVNNTVCLKITARDIKTVFTLFVSQGINF